ncbi:signal transducer, putative (DUF3550/UPF0682) [Wolffia australiana]
MSRGVNIPETELFWSMIDKADRKFAKARDTPVYLRNSNDSEFHKAFKIYTRLWKMQQENRQKLMEAGMKRWEIGEIASRIARLYYGQYLRTSESSYLAEAYIFYEAIWSREYFRDGLSQDASALAKKQMRFLARFLIVCLLLGRREMVVRLGNQLRNLLDECRRNFQEPEFKEWKQILQEISRFLKADTNMMNMRPLRYSFLFDSPPASLPCIPNRKGLKLRDGILLSYHHNEVKFTELTLDTFRMLQCLEWDPSGSFSLAAGDEAYNQGSSHGRSNPLQDMRDPSLPPNPPKAVLYRPTVTQFLVVLATLCEELPPDGILFIYLSAPGCDCEKLCENITGKLESLEITVPDVQSPDDEKLLASDEKSSGLLLGPYGNEGLNCLYPCDLIPFTRKPLFLVIDSNVSDIFKIIHGAEKGPDVAMLLSPKCPLLPPEDASESNFSNFGSQFTMFLTNPLLAFCLLLGIPSSEIEQKEFYHKAEELLLLVLNEWSSTLISSGTLAPVWIEVLGDTFLRRLLLRFILCRAVLSLRLPSVGPEYLPGCLPALPDCARPENSSIQSGVEKLAEFFGVSGHFSFLPAHSLPKDDAS